MECEVKVYSDGSWLRTGCEVRGDSDEDPDDYCKCRKPHESEKNKKRPKR